MTWPSWRRINIGAGCIICVAWLLSHLPGYLDGGVESKGPPQPGPVPASRRTSFREDDGERVPQSTREATQPLVGTATRIGKKTYRYAGMRGVADAALQAARNAFEGKDLPVDFSEAEAGAPLSVGDECRMI